MEIYYFIVIQANQRKRVLIRAWGDMGGVKRRAMGRSGGRKGKGEVM